MGQLSSSKRKNFKETLWRNMNAAFFGEVDVSGIEQDILTLNGVAEMARGLNAAGTGTISLIGLNSSDEVVVGPNAVVLPTAEHFTANLDAATAVSRSIYIAAVALQVANVNIVFGTASASGTFTIEKLTGTQAPGGGTVMLTGTISTAGTANTVLPGTLVATLATLQLAAGNRIGAVFSGTETGLVGLNISITLQRI